MHLSATRPGRRGQAPVTFWGQAPVTNWGLAPGSGRGRRLLGGLCDAMLFVALALGGAGLAAAQEERLAPVDAGAADASWVQFHKRMATAIEQRDTKYLLSILDPKIRNSFETPDGVKSFVDTWELEPARAKDSKIWSELRSLLRFGAAPVESAAGERLLCLPYVAVRWPPTIDPINYAAIIVADAPVFAKPSTLAPIIDTLSFQIVGVDDWDLDDEAPKSTQRWVRVVLKKGMGFVAAEHIRSPIEARACFSRGKGNGPWRMVSFTVGGG
jgi:hypothetical protein